MTVEKFLEIMDCTNATKILKLVERYQRLLKSGKCTYEQLIEAIDYDYDLYNDKYMKNMTICLTFDNPIKEFNKYKLNNDSQTVINSKNDYDCHVKALQLAYTDIIEQEINSSIQN